MADIDLDAQRDLVFSYSHAEGNLSGVAWLKAPSWPRHELSGAPGTKYDTVELVDLDGDGDIDSVVTEQIELLGLSWHKNTTITLP
jgi:hypothetical protein